MKKHSREVLAAYYSEAGTWASDRLAAIEGSRRVAWIVAAAVGVIAVVQGVALLVLLPLKTVEPYTLLVDRSTGFVQALKPLETSQITPDRALVQSMLVQYVIARESFDIATLQSSYRKVGLWSAERARADYVAQMQASNRQSPLVRYPRSAILETRVKSVSPLTADTVLVRFETARIDHGDGFRMPQAWAAVVRYRFSGEPMSADDRFLNPLGFQVIAYRKDQEALLPPNPSAPDGPSIGNESTASLPNLVGGSR